MRSNVLTTAVLAAICGAPSTALAQGAGSAFAPPDSKGILKVTIEVTGSGRDGYRSGVHDSLHWTIRHRLSYETALLAFEPMIDTSSASFAAMDATEAAAREVLDDDAESLQAKWDEKVDACDGAEACEMRVMAAMMADPDYRRLVLKVQDKGGGVMAKARGIDLGFRYQRWAWRTGPDLEPPTVKGMATVERREQVYGMVSTDGTGAHHGARGWSASGPIDPLNAPTKAGHLMVDLRSGDYRIEIPVDFVLPVEECEGPLGVCKPNGRTIRVSLLDGASSSSEDAEFVVTATGTLAAPMSPKAGGSQSFPSKLAGEGSVEVKIEWSFQVAGRAP
ncbi:MAG: hypothetical protein AB7R55_02185 [Gemmatimonadales bacterium]